MATNTGAYKNYMVLGAIVVSLATIALLIKLLHSWLRSLKHAEEADRRGRRPPTPSDGSLHGSGLSRDRAVVASPQPPAPAAVAVEMVRAMGPLVCTYLRADGWPVEVACAVCLAELADGEALRALPVCMQYFHAACVGEWLRAHDTCPLCRAPLAPPAANDAAA